MKTIPIEQVIGRLRAENPWWTAPHRLDPRMASYRPRLQVEALGELVAESAVRRAVILLGPRRVGKTVLLHHVVQRLLNHGVAPAKICLISVDHPLYNGQSLGDLLQAYRQAADVTSISDAYIFFDEIQYLSDWERHLKALVDDFDGTRFVASGSAAAALRLKSLESGAGRFTEFFLPPLSFHEYLHLLDDDQPIEWDARTQTARCADVHALNARFIDYLNYGGYPEVALTPEVQADPGRFIKSDIIDKVLLRDLPSLYGIQDIQELNALFTALAYNTAGEVSIDALSKRSGVAKNTIKRYIEYLEAAFLLKVVHRVDRDGRRFQRATAFKTYLTNPSMRAALFAPVGADDPAMGELAETAVFSQWLGNPGLLHYARWGRHEVDLIRVDARREPQAIVEVKWSDRPPQHLEELAGVVAFCRAHRLHRATVTTRTVHAVVEQEGLSLEFVPTALFCYAEGRRQAEGRRIR